MSESLGKLNNVQKYQKLKSFKEILTEAVTEFNQVYGELCISCGIEVEFQRFYILLHKLSVFHLISAIRVGIVFSIRSWNRLYKSEKKLARIVKNKTLLFLVARRVTLLL